jgi:hypothetical protein
MRHSMRTLGLLAVTGLLAGSLHAQTVTFTPDIANLALNPGEQATVHAQVCLPGQPAKADIYLLADTTTSMAPVINQIKANAQQIVTTLLATPNVDIKVGCGQYRDFPFDVKPFDHQVSPVKNANTVVAAINQWFAGGGGDGSESQFYALYKLSTDPSIGFRPDAKRIIVWFGDSPGHDPICDIFVGGGVPTFEITEALTTSALQAAGPNNGTTVIAIGSPTGYPNALDDDPTASAQDYSFFCTVGGTSGQASRIAQATNGLYTQITDPDQITTSILDAVDSVLTAVDVSCTAIGGITPFVASIVPPIYNDVFLPSDPNKQVCVDFDVLLQGPPCSANEFLHEGKIEVEVNTTPLGSLPVTVTQSQCYTPTGLVIIGIRRIDGVPLMGGDANDLMLVQPGILLTVPFDQIPAFRIPADQIFDQFDVYAQTAVNDPAAFPSDPVKTSPGLKVLLGANDLGTNYGVGTGLDLTLAQPALLGGMFVLKTNLSP